MAKHSFLLLHLESKSRGNNFFTDVWFSRMNEDLVLVPQGRHTAILAVMNDNVKGIKQHDLAAWIEEPDETFDHLPLFIIWECNGGKSQVHEYAPFENSVRQLVKVYDKAAV